MTGTARWSLGAAAAVAVALVVAAAWLLGDSAEVATGDLPPSPSPGASDVDALFVPPPAGTQQSGELVRDDLEILDLYLDDARIAAYRDHGFRRLARRDYYGNHGGGATIALTEVADPQGLLLALDGAEGGLGTPYPEFPDGRIRGRSADLGDGATEYFHTITFVTGAYVVEVTGWAYTPEDGERRALEVADDELALLSA